MIELSCPLGAIGCSRNSYVEVGDTGALRISGAELVLRGDLYGAEQSGSCGAVGWGAARTDVVAAIMSAGSMAGRWFDAIF